MSKLKTSKLRAELAVLSAIGTAVAIQLCVVAPSPGTIAVLLCANGLLALVTAFVWHRRQSAELTAITRFANKIGQIFVGEDNADALEPSATLAAPLRNALRHIRDTIIEATDRARQANNSRLAADVRAKQIDENLQRAGDIVSSLATPVVAIDHFDEIMLANDSATELLDIAQDQTDGRPLAQQVKCQSLVDLMTSTRRRQSKSQRVADLELPADDGTLVHYKVTCRNIRMGNETDDHRGAVAVFSNVSGEKAIQKRNAEFVSAVSHEMKAPLSGIKAYVELLADGDAKDEATQDEFLEVINSQADRLQRLIDNMLNLARIEAGVVEVSKKPISLNEVLEEAFSVVEPAAIQENISLTSELSAMYIGVFADRDLLLQAAINLLSNAIKYTPQSGEVALASHLDGDVAVFDVQDTGVGLSEEDCERVFDRFYRVKRNRKMAPGTGLGLPLVKHIVEDVHGGQLRVTSQLGEGSCFAISLPGVAT